MSKVVFKGLPSGDLNTQLAPFGRKIGKHVGTGERSWETHRNSALRELLVAHDLRVSSTHVCTIPFHPNPMARATEPAPYCNRLPFYLARHPNGIMALHSHTPRCPKRPLPYRTCCYSSGKSALWTNTGQDRNFQRTLSAIGPYKFQGKFIWTNHWSIPFPGEIRMDQWS